MSNFHHLHAKALSDVSFRKQLSEDPHGALQSLGITPTPEIVEAVQDVIRRVEKIGKDMGADADELKQCFT